MDHQPLHDPFGLQWPPTQHLCQSLASFESMDKGLSSRLAEVCSIFSGRWDRMGCAIAKGSWSHE